MAKKNKNKKSLFRKLDGAFDDGETHLTFTQGRKLLQHNDPDVKALETKHPIMNFNGEVFENNPMYLYEPYSRYKRIENPDYKRYKNYSLAGILTGAGLLALGLASFNYALAYAGAALTIASFGYRSGQWWRNRKVDLGFEKVPSKLEKKILQELRDSPDTIFSDYRNSGYLTRRAAKKAGIKETDKDKELYVKRMYRLDGCGPALSARYYYSSLHHAPRQSSNRSWIGGLGIALTSVLALLALSAPNEYPSAAGPLFYAAGSTALATLGHYLGYIFSKKTAPAEYRKVGSLEEKVNATQGTYGSETPAQPKYGKLSTYEEELTKIK